MERSHCFREDDAHHCKASCDDWFPVQANGNANSSGSDLGSLDSGAQQQMPLNVKAGVLSEKLSKRFGSFGGATSPDTIKKRGLRVCSAPRNLVSPLPSPNAVTSHTVMSRDV